jgi:hypothetical protein
MGIMEIVASANAEPTEYKRKSVKQFISHNNSS